MNLVERCAVTQATLDHFAARPFDWAKAATCVHLVRRHVRAMGHRVPGVPRFRSALTARAALTARGWATVADMMDAVLPRIEPAYVLQGDVVQLPSESAALGALAVALSNGRVMGYFEGVDGFAVIQPLAAPIAAWRT